MHICKTLNHHFKEIHSFLSELKNLKEGIVKASDSKKLAELKKHYTDLMSSKSTQISTNIKEAKKLSEFMTNIENDYNETITALLNKNLIKIDNLGEYYYTAEYDGRYEPTGRGKDFKGKNFIVPKMPEILDKIIQKTIELYFEMKNFEVTIEDGSKQFVDLKPSLQLVPLAYSNTIFSQIDEYEQKQILYYPDKVQKKDESKVKVTGGLTKSELIDNLIKRWNGAWQVEIAPMISVMPRLTSIDYERNAGLIGGFSKSIIDKYEFYNEFLYSKGYSGQIPESYFTSSIKAFNQGIALDDFSSDKTYSCFLATSFREEYTDEKTIAGRKYQCKDVLITGSVSTGFYDDIVRFRPIIII